MYIQHSEHITIVMHVLCKLRRMNISTLQCMVITWSFKSGNFTHSNNAWNGDDVSCGSFSSRGQHNIPTGLFNAKLLPYIGFAHSTNLMVAPEVLEKSPCRRVPLRTMVWLGVFSEVVTLNTLGSNWGQVTLLDCTWTLTLTHTERNMLQESETVISTAKPSSPLWHSAESYLLG